LTTERASCAAPNEEKGRAVHGKTKEEMEGDWRNARRGKGEFRI